MTAPIRPSSEINYFPCRYGSSKIMFRGPQRRVRGEYVACIGGSETFGRFIPVPYPDQLEQELNMPCINLGCQQAGIDAFLTSPGLIDICSMAQVTIVQVMGAPNMSNRFYTVDPRHNERFLRASKQFKELFPEVDFSQFTRTDHMLTVLAQVGRDRLHLVRQEIQSAWVARMRTLLGQIDGRKILLWVADHLPFQKGNGSTICREPLFVDRAMLNALDGHADALIEVVVSQQEVMRGRGEMVFTEFEQIDARAILGPIAHQRVVQALLQSVATSAQGTLKLVQPVPQLEIA